MPGEPAEGIQPSAVADIGRGIETLRGGDGIAILLVGQYSDVAPALGQRLAVMDRGGIVLAGVRGELDEHEVRCRLPV